MTQGSTQMAQRHLPYHLHTIGKRSSSSHCSLTLAATERVSFPTPEVSDDYGGNHILQKLATMEYQRFLATPRNESFKRSGICCLHFSSPSNTSLTHVSGWASRRSSYEPWVVMVAGPPKPMLWLPPKRRFGCTSGGAVGCGGRGGLFGRED